MSAASPEARWPRPQAVSPRCPDVSWPTGTDPIPVRRGFSQPSPFRLGGSRIFCCTGAAPQVSARTWVAGSTPLAGCRRSYSAKGTASIQGLRNSVRKPFSTAGATGRRPLRLPLHLPTQAECERLMSWDIHRPICNDATVSAGGHARKQWRLPGCRCAREPRRSCGDSVVKLAVQPPWTGSLTGRRRSRPTGLHGRRPSRRGATPVRRPPGAETRNDAEGAVAPAVPGIAAGRARPPWSGIRIVRPLM